MPVVTAPTPTSAAHHDGADHSAAGADHSATADRANHTAGVIRTRGPNLGFAATRVAIPATGARHDAVGRA